MAEKRIKRIISVVFDKASATQVQSEIERSLAAAGERGGDAFLREMRETFNLHKAKLAEDLAAGVIDEKEFKKQTEEANRAFNNVLLANIRKARAEGKLTEQEYVKLARQFKNVGNAGGAAWTRIKSGIVAAGAALATYFGVRQIARFGKSAIDAAVEAEAVWAQLAATVEGAGIEFATVQEEINGVVASLQATTTLGDEDVAKTLQTLILLSGDYEASLRNVALVADVAAARNMDLETAADLVGKAMAGNTTQLTRQFPLLKETNDVLGELSATLDGQAERARSTWAGQIKRLSDGWGDFKEEIGKALIEAGGGTSVLETLIGAVKGLTRWIAENREGIRFWVGGALKLAVDGLRTLWLVTTDVVNLFQAAFRHAMAIGADGLALVAEGAALVHVAMGKLLGLFSPARAAFEEREAKLWRDRAQALRDYAAGAREAAAADLRLNRGTKPGELPGLPKPGGLGRPGGGGGEPSGDRRRVGTFKSITPGDTSKGAPILPDLFGISQEITKGKEQVEKLEGAFIDVAVVAEEAADAMTNAWARAFEQLGEDGADIGSFFEALGESIAGAFAGALAEYASGEAKKHLAAAIGMAADALGFAAFGNVPSASLATASIGEHLAAAAAWSALAGAGTFGSRSLSGKRGGHGVSSSRDVGVSKAANSQQAPNEINVYINPLDPSNPAYQRNIGEATQHLTERYGANSKITVKPYPMR